MKICCQNSLVWLFLVQHDDSLQCFKALLKVSKVVSESSSSWYRNRSCSWSWIKDV